MRTAGYAAPSEDGACGSSAGSGSGSTWIVAMVQPTQKVSPSTKASRSRSAASGCLEVVMPKADANDVAIGLGHVRDRGENRRAACGIRKGAENGCKETSARSVVHKGKGRERLGQSMMKVAGATCALRIAPDQVLDGQSASLLSHNDGEDESDGPPPLL